VDPATPLRLPIRPPELPAAMSATRHQLPAVLSNIDPMLLVDGRLPVVDDPGFTYELKYDGYRLLCSVDDGAVALKTRNGANSTSWFPELVRSLSTLPGGTHVLDGEVCVLDDIGRANFDLMHTRAMARRWRPGLEPVVYCVFDCLVYQSVDVRSKPLRERKALLESLLRKPMPSTLLVSGVQEGAWLFQQANALLIEGIVAKELDSPYLSGQRSPHWLKIKRKGAIPAQRFRRGT
jgi:bifunctional non-homologous end joining protein LigD